MSVGQGHNGGYKCLCPACGSRMRIMKGDALSLTASRMYGQCTNLVCSTTVTGTLSFDFALEPSKLRKPRIKLPLSRAKTKALPKEKPTMAERVAECRERGLDRMAALRELGCPPETLDFHWNVRQPAQTEIFA